MLPLCPATTTTIFLMLSHTQLPRVTHSLTTAAATVPAPTTKHTSTHTHTPLMTSMTSPPSLAWDETVTVINCDAHVDTTNHKPTTPSRPVQPTERPAGIQGDERCLRLCPFPSFQRLLGSGSNTRHHRAQSKRADGCTIRPQGYALLCLCLRLLNCPIPSHSQAELYHLFLQIERRFRSTDMRRTPLASKLS
jgi:hypothetical protein